MRAPPPGTTARPATAEDREAVLDLMCRVDVEDLGEVDSTMDDLEWHWGEEGVDLARDSLLLLDGAGALVGYLLVSPSGAGDLFAETYAAPGPERTALDDYLLAEAFVRAGRRASEAGRPLRLRVPAVEGEARIAVLEDEGFVPLRWFVRMEIRFGGPHAEPDPPEGLRITPLPHPDDDVLAAAHAAVEEAFADHWEHAPRDLDAWRARHVDAEGFDPSMWAVGFDGEEVAGVAIGRPEPELGGLWIPIVAVRRPWRGRGLAGALLRTLFARATARPDLPAASLLVDAENPTGATRVYEAAGMTRRWAVVQMARDVEPTAS